MISIVTRNAQESRKFVKDIQKAAEFFPNLRKLIVDGFDVFDIKYMLELDFGSVTFSFKNVGRHGMEFVQQYQPPGTVKLLYEQNVLRVSDVELSHESWKNATGMCDFFEGLGTHLKTVFVGISKEDQLDLRKVLMTMTVRCHLSWNNSGVCSFLFSFVQNLFLLV